jgi:hypothetical protein
MTTSFRADLPAPAAARAGVHSLLHRSRPTVYPVAEGGVLLFPGVPEGVAPPAQLGPLMSPPSRGALWGR